MVNALLQVASEDKFTFTSSNAHTLRLDLEAKTAFVFPQGCSDARFHSWRRDLAGMVKRV